MARETIKARNARVSALLAEYDATMAALRKLEKMAKDLKLQVREIEPGPYGEWTLARGTAREIMDQPAVVAAYKARGEALPTKMTEPPLVVLPAARA